MPELEGLGVSRWPLGSMGFDSGATYERRDTTGLLSGTSGFSGLPGMLFKAAGIVGEREQEAAKDKAKADANEATLKHAAARGVVEDSLKILALDDYPNSAKKELYNRIIRKAIYDSFPQLGDWAPVIPENVPWGPHFTKHVKEFVAVVTAQNDQRSKELALQAMWGEMCANPKTAPLCKMQQDYLAAVRRDQVEVIASEFGNILNGTATPQQVDDFYAQKADAQHPGRHGEEEKDRLIRRERGLIITDGILLAEARRAAARKAAKEGFLPVPETSRLVDPLVLPGATPPALGGPGMAPGGVAAPAPGSAPVRIEDIGVQPSPSAATGSVLPTTGGGVVRRNRTQLTPEKEQEFRTWYEAWASVAGIDPNPDNPRHQYDYRGAFLAGAAPSIDPTDGKYHWSSAFKDQDHPTRFVHGVDTTRRAGVVLGTVPKNVPPEVAAETLYKELLQQGMNLTEAATQAHMRTGGMPVWMKPLVPPYVQAEVAAEKKKQDALQQGRVDVAAQTGLAAQQAKEQARRLRQASPAIKDLLGISDKVKVTVGQLEDMGVTAEPDLVLFRDAVNTKTFTRNFIDQATQAKKLATEDPAGFGASGTVARLIGGMQAQAQNMAKALGFADTLSTDAGKFAGTFRELGITNARIQSMIFGLAYSAAAARGQTGHAVSDRDIVNHLTQIGASVQDPAAFAQVLDDISGQMDENYRIKVGVLTGLAPHNVKSFLPKPEKANWKRDSEGILRPER